MDKEIIVIEPQIIQFNSQSKQILKVTNRSSELIQNCFFCLYNSNKYQFSPQNFSLQPKEHKLISVVLKLRSQDGSNKQFAYLKSKNMNKRLTLINSNANTHTNQVEYKQQEKVRQYESEDVYSLNPGSYREVQKSAYQKIISQKQAYINKLQKKIQEQSKNLYGDQRQFSKTNQIYLAQIHELELKVALLTKEKEQLILDQIEAHGKLKQCKILLNNQELIDNFNSRISSQNQEIENQSQEIKMLELQCQQFLAKIQEKQIQIKDLQYLYTSKIDGIIKEGEKKLQQMEEKINQERRQLQISTRKEKDQIVQQLQSKISFLKGEKEQKQKQLYQSQLKSDDQTKMIALLKEENKENIRLQIQNQQLKKANSELKQRTNKFEQSLFDLKEEAITYKNKFTDLNVQKEKSDKYLEVALESCKNENKILAETKEQLQKRLSSAEQQLRNAREQLNKLSSELTSKIGKYKERENSLLEKLQEQKAQIQKRLKQNSNLINENKRLVDQNNKIEAQCIKEKGKIQNLEDTILNKEKRLQEKEEQLQKMQNKLQQESEEKEKLQKKVDRYRRQAKKSIHSISESAKEELKKIEIEKDELCKKIEELELSVENKEKQQRLKTRTQYEQSKIRRNNGHQSQLFPQSLQERQRKTTGIKNQRRQIELSQSNSQTEVDLDRIYSQLGQLRQFKNFMFQQMKKLGPKYGLETEMLNQSFTSNPVLSGISYFKQLENKISKAECPSQNILSIEKQNHYLKGRLSELEPIIKSLSEKKENESVKKQEDIDLNLIEYLREEMRAQYKKLSEALKFSQDKYDILQKKIYEEYRSRIIQLLGKKDRDQYTINKIETILQRFIDGLSNTSHKQAVLAKQVKLKHEARKQASVLKERINTMVKQREKEKDKSKRPGCVRQEKKISMGQTSQWLAGVQLETKMLSAESQKLKLQNQCDIQQIKLQKVTQQLKYCQSQLQNKQTQVQRLKKQVIQICRIHQKQKIKQEQEIQQMKIKYLNFEKYERQISILQAKQKQNTILKAQIQDKNEVVRTLRDKERVLTQMLEESRKNETFVRERERKEIADENRVQDALKDMKQNNRQLRQENIRMKEIIESLNEELSKKNATLNRIKSQNQQYRIKSKAENPSKSQTQLQNQIASLEDQIKKLKSTKAKEKQKKQSQLVEEKSKYQKVKAEHIIQRSGLESSIRVLIDLIKSIYNSLDILLRKRGAAYDRQKYSQIVEHLNPSNIKTKQVKQMFEKMAELLKIS